MAATYKNCRRSTCLRRSSPASPHPDHRDDFVLKGGVLLAAFAARRPTKDIDLQATGLTNDAEDVANRVRAIAAIDLNDGVVFETGSVTASVIREGDAAEYPGIRVRILGTLGRARLTVGIDVNFGDPIWPAPELIDLPRIVQLGQAPVSLLGYPLTMVFAEKIITAIDRGAGNTRWRDFADVYALIRLHQVDANELRISMETVADYRRVTLAPLLPRLADMPDRAQEKWRIWRARVHREQELPESFDDVLAARFADPALTRSTAGRWNPSAGAWG
jgi:hypothetical protein